MSTMTKTEAREIIKRIRQAARDAERAVRENDQRMLDSACSDLDGWTAALRKESARND